MSSNSSLSKVERTWHPRHEVTKSLCMVFVFAMGILGLSIARAVNAQEEMQLELQELQDEIDMLSAQLTAITVKESKSRDDQKALEGKVRTLRLDRESLDKEIKSLEQRAIAAALEVESLAREIARHEKFSSARMRAVYMNGGFAPSQVLASAQSLDAASLTGFYLSKVRDADVRRIENLAKLKLDRASAVEGLEKIAASQTVKRAQVKQKEDDQKRALNQLKDLMKRLATERADLEHSVLALKAKALRLETVVSSVTEGALVPPPQDQEKVAGSEVPAVVPNIGGLGLSAAKGRLPQPVRGRISRGFGKYKPSEAREIILHKGLEFQVEQGSEVRAVATGRVMFVGKMPAYGGLIILDHGDRYYSLYGYLRDVRVGIGEEVPGGKELAVTDDTGRFYFEIRKNGSPINPSLYLAKSKA